jgi:general secretion pathway protein L
VVSAINMLSDLSQWLPGKVTRGDRNTATTSIASHRQLELFLPLGWPNTEDPVRWCVRQGESIEDQGEISNPEELDPELRSLPLTVLLDPFDTAILQAGLPSLSRKNLLRALPYALEDRLLGDVEQQFFILLYSSNGDTNVCVIAHERMQSVLAALDAAGLHPHTMLPAVGTTPLLENAWTLVFNDRCGWIRTGAHAGMACTIKDQHPPYALIKRLSEAKENSSSPTALLVVNAPENFDSNEWSAETGLEVLLPEGGFWENLGQGATEFNLLQGPYKPKSTTQSSLSKLRLAFALILVLVIGNVAVFGVDWLQLHRQSNQIKSEMISIFKQSFPGQASAVIDPVRQMQTNLDRLRQDKGGAQSTDFLALLTPVSRALESSQTQNATVSKVRYANKSIVVDIRLADYQKLDQLKQSFTDNQLSVQVLQADSGANGVQATLKLQARQESKR